MPNHMVSSTFENFHFWWPYIFVLSLSKYIRPGPWQWKGQWPWADPAKAIPFSLMRNAGTQVRICIQGEDAFYVFEFNWHPAENWPNWWRIYGEEAFYVTLNWLISLLIIAIKPIGEEVLCILARSNILQKISQIGEELMEKKHFLCSPLIG